ncbi:hypothetical protein DV736_g2592, partial [Chaetothyriales sp. CBS 134916]
MPSPYKAVVSSIFAASATTRSLLRARLMEPQTPWEEVARRHWLHTDRAPSRVPGDVLKREIWDPLERAVFDPQALLPLSQLHIVERFLWPTYTDDAPDQHVLLIALFALSRLHFALFADRADTFASLFHRVLSLSFDPSQPWPLRLALLCFVIGAFDSLENDVVRKECAPLKRYDATAAHPEAQARLKLDRIWLYSLVLDFLRIANLAKPEAGHVVYCERFVELLIDLSNQLPTRRYTQVLLRDMNLLPALVTSVLYQNAENTLFHQLVALLKHFDALSIDLSDQREDWVAGVQSTHHAQIVRLQTVAFKHFEHKLRVLALSNDAAIDQRAELEQHFGSLSDDELKQLCTLLGFRTAYPAALGIPAGRALWLECLVYAYERPVDFGRLVGQLSISPTEQGLYEPKLLHNDGYDGAEPLAMPKLNLQYLSLADFMWRSFELYQAESFYAIRKDVEGFVRRMKPRAGRDTATTLFDGFTKMAMPIDHPAIIDVAPPRVGTSHAAYVRSEVSLDVSRLTDSMRQEWDNLRPKDVVYLLHVTAPAQPNGRLGHAGAAGADIGLLKLRTAEVVQVLDDNGRALRDVASTNGYGARPRRRRLMLDLDPVTFQKDKAALAKTNNDVYATLNVIARRPGRENNFKPVLETIQKLVGSKAALPSWLDEVFLGYGDAQSASFPHLDNKIAELDFLDTFLDWHHLNESFPGRSIEVGSGQASFFPPPYLVAPFIQPSLDERSNAKKRRRAQMEAEDQSVHGPIRVRSYKAKNTGPYPIDKPKTNTIRFTPKQVEAIVSGTQPGLSLVVGPPGTGKTDVATQIINLLYHNFPEERILLVAHSNQALNQLFQKLIALDIDPRHLLRLGHGEEELESEQSYSKYGRVESFLEIRQTYLAEVARLAASIGAEGAHGSSCETADYFDQVFVEPAWIRFWHIANSDAATTDSITAAFPFHAYFSSAPQPLFPPSASVADARDIASGCEYHITKIFSELASIRPFEILRHSRDQANHLLTSSARIVAMTTTHAAMRRAEIANLGFHYHTLIMEEAAQITEVESFIPMAMQNPRPRSGELPLKRVVLVGDHLQNSPVIQSPALAAYSNFSQSLFQRLIRLGVPSVVLDAQGRCRPELAELFNWRYQSEHVRLTNLPLTSTLPEFTRANAGFRYTYQFINVPTYYQGEHAHDESEPTAHYFQNLGEAEYAVALYQYMRLLGYPASTISILTTYAGQRVLIRDVLNHRCRGNKLFGLPRTVSTVDRYQGEQNEYIILSLTRTKHVGFMNDLRRITVALSRARLGFYVLGRQALWEQCLALRPAMDLFLARPTNLVVTTGELYPTTDRTTADQDQKEEDEAGVQLQGVEHLGQYVYEMTQAKVKQLGGTVVVDETVAAENNDDAEEADNPEDEEEPATTTTMANRDSLHERV